MKELQKSQKVDDKSCQAPPEEARNATIFGSVQFIMTSAPGPDVTRTFPSQLPSSLPL